MKTKHIIIGLIIVLLVLFFVQKKEHAGSTPPLSNEAIQNIAKVYADTTGTASFNNIQTKDTATVNGMATFKSVSNFKGGKAGGGGETHFPFWNGENFIRGDTNIDGKITINGETNINGAANFKGGKTDFNGGTHFPYSNGENYIRGPTNMDGATIINGATTINGDANFNKDIKHKGQSLVNCNWNGERGVMGDEGCEDDIFINCQNNKVVNFRFAC
jgi:hypothetical protein